MIANVTSYSTRPCTGANEAGLCHAEHASARAEEQRADAGEREHAQGPLHFEMSVDGVT